MVKDQLIKLGGRNYHWRYTAIDNCPKGWHRRAWCPDDCWDWANAKGGSVESGKERKRLWKKFLATVFADILHDLTKNEEMRLACLLRMMGANRKQIRAVEVDPAVSKIKRRIAEFVADPVYSHYVPAVTIARLLNELLLPDQQTGELGLQDLIRDEEAMHNIFERFARRFFRYRYQSAGWDIAARSYDWSTGKKGARTGFPVPTLNTDITMRHSKQAVVIDTKYYKSMR